jgi:hypothetical protein
LRSSGPLSWCGGIAAGLADTKAGSNISSKADATIIRAIGLRLIKNFSKRSQRSRVRPWAYAAASLNCLFSLLRNPMGKKLNGY